jgi:dihydrofolate synthase/folylpolyglutamate synthase
MNYEQAWTFLNDLQFFKIKLGLDAMRSFLGRVGNPHEQLCFVHVGGTNGKGSVASTLLSILSGAGHRVGLYTSPHLSDVRERFRINDTSIAREDFARLIGRIQGVLKGDQITYFECTTTLALLWFAEQKVDLAIMEVGMGGRLDATNVIRPLLSIITNVSMDHEQYLGNTLAEVAGEKAGIIKPGVPVVSGATDPVSRTVIEETCQQRKSPLYLLGRDFHGKKRKESQTTWNWTGWDGGQYRDLPLAMHGAYQVDNAALAVTAVRLLAGHGYAVSGQKLCRGLARTRWPGRLESFTFDPARQPGRLAIETSTRFLLDGAHNPAGVEALAKALESDFFYEGLILVWGAMADKEIGATLATIAPLADTIIFTRPESERSATPDALLSQLPSSCQARVETAPDVATALVMAAAMATKEDLVCVAGSLYLVGRARQLLLGELTDDS